MSVTYRNGREPVNLDEVRQVYLRRGWRGVEKNYAHCNDVIQQLKALLGGNAIEAERRAVQRTGRKAGGRVLEVAGG